MASDAGDYSVRRSDWPHEVTGLNHIPQHKDGQTPPQSRRRSRRRQAGAQPPVEPSADDATAQDEKDDDAQPPLLDFLV